MTKAIEMPPFIPVEEPEPAVQAPESEAMVVMTVRIPPKQKDAIKLLHRQNAKYNSVSHVIQTAIDEFLAKHA